LLYSLALTRCKTTRPQRFLCVICFLHINCIDSGSCMHVSYNIYSTSWTPEYDSSLLEAPSQSISPLTRSPTTAMTVSIGPMSWLVESRSLFVSLADEVHYIAELTVESWYRLRALFVSDYQDNHKQTYKRNQRYIRMGYQAHHFEHTSYR
jgi:hypothetical protein